MSDLVRFGILGLGVGSNRANTVLETMDAELVCICDLQEEKAKKLAKKFGCKWTIDYDEMLRRDDVDVIGVFTSSGTHCDLAIKAMKAGKHVFVTKPMDLRVEKCDAAIETAEKTGVIFAVDFQRRYTEINQKVKIALNKGRLGRLIFGDMRAKWYRSQEYYDGGYPLGWRKRRVTEGGSAANQAVHALDLFQWFMGPVKTVYGRSGTFAHKIETEDLSMAFLTFVNGAWGSIITTTTSYPGFGSEIGITGENGSLIWKHNKILQYHLKDNPEPSLDEFQLNPNRPKNIIEDMVSAVKRGTPVMVDGKEGRKSVAITNAIYESSGTGKIIELR